jgi:hypothetical protein
MIGTYSKADLIYHTTTAESYGQFWTLHNERDCSYRSHGWPVVVLFLAGTGPLLG